MKKIIATSVMSIAALLLFSMSTNAQDNPAITNVGAKVILADQLSVYKVSDVDFGGVFIPKGASATATMDYMGTVSITDGTTGLFNTNSQKHGVLYVSANKTAKFSIEYPATADLTSGANKIVYTPVLYSKTGSEIASSSTVEYGVETDEVGDGSAFSKVVNIAGSIVIPVTAELGLYAGNIDVTVTWK